jgi:hypothetical protein
MNPRPISITRQAVWPVAVAALLGSACSAGGDVPLPDATGSGARQATYVGTAGAFMGLGGAPVAAGGSTFGAGGAPATGGVPAGTGGVPRAVIPVGDGGQVARA